MIDMKAFRTLALLEASSFLILLVATGVKYGLDAPVGVKIMGPIHGVLFLLYVVVALMVRMSTGWSLVKTLLVLLGAIVPFGGFIVDRTVVTPELNALAQSRRSTSPRPSATAG